ncbi:hypothetical protein JG687_00005443 [Phytophthora cactorum]|uniref:Uncharacterized protein n=1 Tax=Phytophthora cactorum TaxID=29920 RepID=A0A8T1UQL3_9STRA|nr:hypothetical protein JG687_00005443 [Phytophthora cactorum]
MREGFIVYIRSWLTGHDRRQHAELVKRLPLHSRSWLSKVVIRRLGTNALFSRPSLSEQTDVISIMAFATLALRKGSRCILTPGECKTRLAGKLGKLGAGPAFANTTRVYYGYAFCSHPNRDGAVETRHLQIRRQRGEKEDGDPDAEEEDYDDATKDAYGARRRELRCGEERQNSNAEERDESSNADEEDEGPDAEEQGGRSVSSSTSQVPDHSSVQELGQD